MGPKRGMELVERLQDVEAVIVDRDGSILVSSGLKSRLQFTDATNK
jgi:thiamine biosynthesis lipoprotein ApbE